MVWFLSRRSNLKKMRTKICWMTNQPAMHKNNNEMKNQSCKDHITIDNIIIEQIYFI